MADKFDMDEFDKQLLEKLRLKGQPKGGLQRLGDLARKLPKLPRIK